MQQQTKIIVFITGLFLLSSIFLFSINDKYLNSESQKNYWVVYFTNPTNQSLNFTIENHSQQNNFHWEAFSGTDKISSGDVNIGQGDMKNIDPDNIQATGKITVDVSDGIDKKEIYKNL